MTQHVCVFAERVWGVSFKVSTFTNVTTLHLQRAAPENKDTPLHFSGIVTGTYPVTSEGIREKYILKTLGSSF